MDKRRSVTKVNQLSVDVDGTRHTFEERIVYEFTPMTLDGRPAQKDCPNAAWAKLEQRYGLRLEATEGNDD